MKKSITLQVAAGVLVMALIFSAIRFSFELLNSKDTLQLILGFVLIVCVVGTPIEILMRYFHRKNQK